MEEVIAVSFNDRRRAKRAFDMLWRANEKLDIELDDAVIVHRDRDGALEYDRDLAPTLDRGLLRAGLWGSLVGALAAVSFTVAADGVLDAVALGACALAGGLIAIIAELVSVHAPEAFFLRN